MALTISNKPKRKDPMQAFFEGADEEQLQGGAPLTAFRAYKTAGGRGPIIDALDAFDAAAPGQQLDAGFQLADQIHQAMVGAGGAPPVTTTDGDRPELPVSASGVNGGVNGGVDGGVNGGVNGGGGGGDVPLVDEGALLNEVMGAIRSDPIRFKSGAGLMDYRTSGGLSLNQLPQSVQDAFNTFRGSGEYNQLLSEAEGKDPFLQLQRADEWRAEQDRIAREAAADAALRAQQAALTTQDSTAAIEQATGPIASDVTNAASFTEGIPLQAEVITAPTANPNTGLNPAINYQLAETAQLDLPSNDELRRNQMALLAEMQNQAEAAGKSAVEGLTLPDLTAVSVPPRQLSAMEQALDTRLTDRLTGGRFLDPQSALTNEAEAQALERLQKRSFLGDSTALDAAERRAMMRMEDDTLLGTNTVLDAAKAKALGRLDETGRGVALDSDLMTDAEALIRQRLLGGESPAMAAQRARIEERYGESMDEGRELLNRLGVLRGGDSADIFNELTRGRDQQMLDVDALGYDLQTQALQDALGYQGRRDTLGLANQELARAAISDVAGIGAQYDQRALAEQGLQRGAISDVAGLAGQRAERDLAEQALRRQAIADTLPFQERRDTLALAEQDLQRAAISDAMERQGAVDQRDLAESQLTGSVRGAATLPARMAQAGLQFDAARLQQDVSDRTLARLLTQTEPTQRELFEEGVRATREQERLFTEGGLKDIRDQDILNQELQREIARSQSRRAEQLQEAELFGEISGLGSDPTLRQTLGGKRFEQDVLNQELQRQLARAADLRAGQVQEAELFGEVGGVGSDPTTRRTRQAFQDELARAAVTGRLDGEETMAGRALASDLLSAQQQRLLQRQAQDAELFGEVPGVGSDPTVRRTRAAEMDAFNQALARAGLTGMFEGEKTQDALSNELQRQLARSADLRAAQAQEADLFGEVAGAGSDPSMRRTLAGRQFESAEARAERALREDELTARLQRDLAKADVTGIYDRKETKRAEEARLARAMQERQLGMQERQLREDELTARLQRDLAKADVTGVYDRQETRQAAQDAFNRRLAEAGLTGEFDGDRTLAGRQVREDELTARLQRELAKADVTGVYDRAPTRQADMDAFSRRMAEAGLTGRYGDEETLAGRQDERAERALESDLLTSQLQRLLSQQAQDAELFGEVAGVGSDPTVRRTRQADMDDLAQAADARAERALTSDLLTSQLQRLLTQQAQDAELFGEVAGAGSDPTVRQTRRAQLEDAAETRAQEGFEDDLLTAALNRRIATAGDLRAGQAQDAALFGYVSGEGSDPTMRPTMGREAMEFEKDIAEAGLTGMYGEDSERTMAREAMDISQRDQLISQILAAADLTQKGRLDEFAGALAAGSDDPLITNALANALDLNLGDDPDNPQIESEVGPDNPPSWLFPSKYGKSDAWRDKDGVVHVWNEEERAWVPMVR